MRRKMLSKMNGYLLRYLSSNSDVLKYVLLHRPIVYGVSHRDLELFKLVQSNISINKPDILKSLPNWRANARGAPITASKFGSKSTVI